MLFRSPEWAAVGRDERDPHPRHTPDAHLQPSTAGEPDRLGVAHRAAGVGFQSRPRRPASRARPRAHLHGCAGPSAPARAQQVERERRALHGQDMSARGAGRAQRELAVARSRGRGGGREHQERQRDRQRVSEKWFQKSRSWSGGSKRVGVDPGSKIRLEPFREPGSAPAKPLGSLTTNDDLDTTLLSEHRVAAGLVVGRPQLTTPDNQTAGDSRPPNAPPLLKPLPTVSLTTRASRAGAASLPQRRPGVRCERRCAHCAFWPWH